VRCPRRSADAEGDGSTSNFVEEQARIVRRIFQMYREGMSPAAIAKLLNAEGVPSPRSKTRYRLCKTWVDRTIREMLCNESYSESSFTIGSVE